VQHANAVHEGEGLGDLAGRGQHGAHVGRGGRLERRAQPAAVDGVAQGAIVAVLRYRAVQDSKPSELKVPWLQYCSSTGSEPSRGMQSAGNIYNPQYAAQQEMNRQPGKTPRR
jgi:hypothetical protein